MDKWIPISKIQGVIDFDAFCIAAGLIVAAIAFYVVALKRISERRHGQIRKRFTSTGMFFFLSALFAGPHWTLTHTALNNPSLTKLSHYFALAALIFGSVAIIKIGQTYVYLYLFFRNISTGVPRLIGNMFTLFFSLFIAGLIASHIFSFDITTLATTSAVFSLVLGLALQDTLGNFFSGLAVQIDSPFKIHDWVEIHNGSDRWVGQIQEINWRATFLLSFSNELIMVPNKTIAQSQILILNHQYQPTRLQQVFRFRYDVNIEEAKRALMEGVEGVAEVMYSPAPAVLVTETTESWITMKIFYSISDYGTRYRTGDTIIGKIIASIQRRGLIFAHQTLDVRERSS